MAWTSEAQRECHKELVDKVVKDMEQGKVFFWDKANYGHPPRNVKPRTDKGHEGEDARYHGKNIMLLTIAAMDKGYTDSRWGTYEAIKEMGGQVRKGELSTKIECWIWSKPKRPRTLRADGIPFMKRMPRGSIVWTAMAKRFLRWSGWKLLS